MEISTYFFAFSASINGLETKKRKNHYIMNSLKLSIFTS